MMTNTNIHHDTRILIVEDTLKNIQVLGTILKQEGYQINIARNGVQALAMLEQVQPALILLDIMMPDMDGFETCRRLKAQPATREIPVIFLTALTDAENIIKGFELGAVDYVTKPFNAAELLARVQTQLELKRNRDRLVEVSQQRMELLHILCHDLANPMHVVISVLDLVDSYAEFDKMRPLLLSAAHNGLEIINLVRRMRSLEQHGLELEALPLREVLDSSCAMLSLRLKAKQLRLELEVSDELWVYAERTSLLNSVLNNLLTNAIKFSYPGQVIQVRAWREADAVLLSVQDHGVGMPPGLTRDLFQVGKVTSREGTGGEEGTGFGMPLVQKFVHAYGGEIRVESRESSPTQPDHGTTVTLRLRQPPESTPAATT